MKKNFILILLLTLSFSCKKSTETPQPNSSINKTFENVKVVDNTSSNNPLTVSENGLEFSSTSTFAQNIKVNDVLVSDKTSKAEFGYLRKITSVSNSNGKIVVATIQASLSDVFEEANISFEQTFIQSDLKNGRLSANQAVPINIDLDYIVKDLDKDYKTENDQLAIKGFLKFEPTFKFNWKREKGLLPEQVDMQLRIKDFSEIKLNMGLGFSGEIPIVPPKILGTSTIIVPTPIGPVPIIFTHVITFKGKFEVGTSFETGAKISSSGEYAMGIKDNFEPFSDIKPKFVFTKPDYPERSAEIKVGIFNPVFESRPYGIDAMKLYLEADAGIKLNVNLDKSPNWTVKKYALGKVGFKPNLSFFLKSVSSDINYTTPDFFENEPPFDQGDFKVKINPIPTNGLVAYYPFNGNANEIISNKTNNEIKVATLTNDRSNKINSAYKFYGIEKASKITSFFSNNIINNSVSLSMWFKLDSHGEWNGTKGGFQQNLLTFGGGWKSGIQVIIKSSEQSLITRFFCSDCSNRTAWEYSDSGNYLGKWRHIVYTIDNETSKLKLYLDGKLVQVNTTNFKQIINPLTIGANPTVVLSGNETLESWMFNPFNGSIDDIRIYNRSLSDTEILALSKE